MAIRWVVLGVIGLICLALGAGCGGGPGYPSARLAGTVTVDGTPIEEGHMTFQPLEAGHGPTAGCEIHGGHYDYSGVPLGKVRVFFNANRATGEIILEPGRSYPKVINIIPAAEQQGRQIEVTGDNLQQDFALKSN